MNLDFVTVTLKNMSDIFVRLNIEEPIEKYARDSKKNESFSAV